MFETHVSRKPSFNRALLLLLLSNFSLSWLRRELFFHLCGVCLRGRVEAAAFPARLPPCLTHSAPCYSADRSFSLPHRRQTLQTFTTTASASCNLTGASGQLSSCLASLCTALVNLTHVTSTRPEIQGSNLSFLLRLYFIVEVVYGTKIKILYAINGLV